MRPFYGARTSIRGCRMDLAKVIGKIVSAPVRIVDLPFRVTRELIGDPEPEKGAFADIATAIERTVERVAKGE